MGEDWGEESVYALEIKSEYNHSGDQSDEISIKCSKHVHISRYPQ